MTSNLCPLYFGSPVLLQSLATQTSGPAPSWLVLLPLSLSAQGFQEQTSIQPRLGPGLPNTLLAPHVSHSGPGVWAQVPCAHWALTQGRDLGLSSGDQERRPGKEAVPSFAEPVIYFEFIVRTKPTQGPVFAMRLYSAPPDPARAAPHAAVPHG